MNEKQATTLAAIVGGGAQPWQSGGGIWLVTVERNDGKMVVFSGDAVSQYDSEEAFESNHATATIEIADPLNGDRWVIVDDEGNVFYEHDELELGWSDEYEAEREAKALESRGEGSYLVVRQDDAE